MGDDEVHPLVATWRKIARASPVDSNGVEDRSLDIAQAFYETFGAVSTSRLFVEGLYVMWMESKMAPEWTHNIRKRSFSQVLYALSRGLGRCSVVDAGSTIVWHPPGPPDAPLR